MNLECRNQKDENVECRNQNDERMTEARMTSAGGCGVRCQAAFFGLWEFGIRISFVILISTFDIFTRA